MQIAIVYHIIIHYAMSNIILHYRLPLTAGRPGGPARGLSRAAPSPVCKRPDTGACEKNIPFTPAFALRSSGKNCSPAPDLVFFKLIITRVFSSGGVFFRRRRYQRMYIRWNPLCRPGRARPDSGGPAS